MSNEVVFRNLLEEILNSTEISQDQFKRAREALDKSVPKPEELTRRERFAIVVDALKPIEFIGVHNIMKFINGNLSVGSKTKRMKIPLSFPQEEIIPEPNLAHFQNLKSCNMFLAIVAIDMTGAKSE